LPPRFSPHLSGCGMLRIFRAIWSGKFELGALLASWSTDGAGLYERRATRMMLAPLAVNIQVCSMIANFR